VTRRRGRRRKQPLDDLKEKTGCWTMKEATLDRIHWRQEATELSKDRLQNV